MSNVGLITYHAAYNFGSTLQAYATQRAIAGLGYNCKIIDYRPNSQRDYYEKKIHWNDGLRAILKDSISLLDYSRRKQRTVRFENFFSSFLVTTEKVYTQLNDLRSLNDKFDVFVSGSDQIINKHSNELKDQPWDALKPYLLSFTQKKKITYASSPANMSVAELQRILPELVRFSSISAREQDSANLLSNLLRRKVEWVVDPTLLLDKEEWVDLATKAAENPDLTDYIVFYSLCGPQQLFRYRRFLQKLAHNNKVKIAVFSPFATPMQNDWCINMNASGPLEFIRAISEAKAVITDSYHGTLFAINFDKPFWSLSDGRGANMRKDQILKALGLESRIITHLDDSIMKLDYMRPFDSGVVKDRLNQYRTSSISYLQRALI